MTPINIDRTNVMISKLKLSNKSISTLKNEVNGIFDIAKTTIVPIKNEKILITVDLKMLVNLIEADFAPNIFRTFTFFIRLGIRAMLKFK